MSDATYPSSPTLDRDLRLARLETLADTLDSRYRIPGTQVRFGWDTILGLVPGVGDLATTGPAAWMMLEGYRMGARKRTLARMGVNAGIDLAVGSIPLVGDLFDLGFKANRRNLSILRRDLSARRLPPS